jgi:uncharacterized protein YegP (UPF0339 family)
VAAEFELYKSGGQYRWRLQAGNNEIIATGGGYTTKSAAEKGVEAVERVARTAPVNDKTSD